jgi:hypothetical protein
MSLKFGVDISHSLQNVLPLYGAFGGIYPFAATQTNSTGTSAGTGGSPWASFMLGVVNGNVTLRNTSGAVLLPLESGSGLHPGRLEGAEQPEHQYRPALQPLDAAHREVQQSGRVPSRSGAILPAGHAADAGQWPGGHIGDWCRHSPSAESAATRAI